MVHIYMDVTEKWYITMELLLVAGQVPYICSLLFLFCVAHQFVIVYNVNKKSTKD